MDTRTNKETNRQVLLREVLQLTGEIHWPTLIMGGLSVLFLIAMKRFFSKIPAALLVVAIGIGAVFFFGLEEKGIDILGPIPAGLPAFQLPEFTPELLQEISGLAMTLALIGFLEAISIAKSIEAKHNSYRVRPNQELVALGLGNMVGSLFQLIPQLAGSPERQ